MLMRSIVAAAAASLAALPLAAQGTDWSWHGTMPAGRTLEIRNLNGTIAADAASGSEVEITTRKLVKRGSGEGVEVRMEQTEDGVIVCAIWPGQLRDAKGCRSDGGRRERDRDAERWYKDNDVEVQFTVHVPKGVQLVAGTVNGDIRLTGLTTRAEGTTVNGDVRVETTEVAKATTVNGSVVAKLGRADWRDELAFSSVNGDVQVTLPASADFDITASTVNGDIRSDFSIETTGRLRRQKVRGRVGEGGRSLDLVTVNGSVSILKAD